MLATVFAGDKEYFSGAVTSSARVANLIAGQANSRKVDEIAGVEAKEVQYGEKTYQDNIPQIDTDSVVFSTNIKINGKNITIGNAYDKFQGKEEKRDDNNFIKHVEDDISTPSFNREKLIIEHKKVNYIMKHKVKKRMFKIKINE